MHLIELHILQSFPVSCLNRDDVGAPKTAVFGGVNRARISSQCLKRAIRELAHDLAPDRFAANRSRLIIQPLAKAMQEAGADEAQAMAAAKAVGDYLATLDAGKGADAKPQVKTLMFLSPAEIQAIGAEVAAALLAAPPAVATPGPEEGQKRKGKAKDAGPSLADIVKKACKEAVKRVQLKDAADIAIFGRMVASDHSLTVEGAGMFSHAISTHKADNEVDFWTAVDDLKPQDAGDAGTGGMGTAEFTSACYYRYAALNLGLLADPDHLGALTLEERQKVVDAFLRAALLAVPDARRNSMNANTVPGYVLGIVKDQGQPLQLVNAFEKPVWSKGGLVDASVAAMLQHHDMLKKTWGVQTAAELAIPEVSLDDFCREIVVHVG